MVSMKEFKEHVEMIETYIANFNRIESVILPGYRKEVEIKHDKLAQELKQLSNYTRNKIFLYFNILLFLKKNILKIEIYRWTFKAWKASSFSSQWS